MMEVHLYGRLRRYGASCDPTIDCILEVEPRAEQQLVEDLVASLGIPPQEVASVFRNGHWQQEGLKASLAGVTRLGLFPHTMSLLYV